MARVVLNTQAFVLHSRPYRETSLLVDMLTREQGKLRCVVRGAKNKKSPKVALLQPFLPLQCEFMGSGELRNLGQLDTMGQSFALAGTNLFCGLYLNELLLRICPNEYADPELFDAYQTTLRHLAGAQTQWLEALLREFELYLLQHIGVLGRLDSEAEGGLDLVDEGCYRYQIGIGVIACMPSVKWHFSGRVFIDVANQIWHEQSLLCAKIICRQVISDLLGDRPLKSRELFKTLRPNSQSSD
jgi:DNA repair protein RecO (recombination protein O)